VTASGHGSFAWAGRTLTEWGCRAHDDCPWRGKDLATRIVVTFDTANDLCGDLFWFPLVPLAVERAQAECLRTDVVGWHGRDHRGGSAQGADLQLRELQVAAMRPVVHRRVDDQVREQADGAVQGVVQGAAPAIPQQVGGVVAGRQRDRDRTAHGG
jgi:hypothetical protein